MPLVCHLSYMISGSLHAVQLKGSAAGGYVSLYILEHSYRKSFKPIEGQ